MDQHTWLPSEKHVYLIGENLKEASLLVETNKGG
jgi:hypothetical protein